MYSATEHFLRLRRQRFSFAFPCCVVSGSAQEAASLSMEAGVGGGRSLLQYRGGYRERERERERQRKIKERAEIYAPVEFKVGEKMKEKKENHHFQLVTNSLTSSLGLCWVFLSTGGGGDLHPPVG